MKLKNIVLPALFGLLPLSAPYAQAAELQRADVEQIVREYMLSHPELLIEMSNALRAQQEAEQGKADIALIKQHSQALFNDAADPVGGNAKGTQTIVEFVDYNCGYCKRATPALRELLASSMALAISRSLRSMSGLIQIPRLTRKPNSSARRGMSARVPSTE